MHVTFLLNGETVEVETHPTQTLLDWLREEKGLTGTKEGCNEGDCGACSVMISDDTGARAFNACLLFLPQLHGKAVRTVEGIAAPDGALHPVQQTMIENHGSQCGFCTPGFIISMATAHKNGRTDHDRVLAGNLCRCTGYAPIIRAAKAAETAPIPAHLNDKPLHLGKKTDIPAPQTSDELATWYMAHPNGRLIAGATDLGLWVTKDFRDLGTVAFLNQCTDLKNIEETETEIRIGAAVTMNTVRDAVAPYHPSYAALINRYASDQIRNAATIGGNIANGSPIGDNPPPLIALGATLHLRRADTRRSLPVEAFFLEYGKQDLAPSEFIEAITIPKFAPNLRCYKISKRFDQDISALCAGFSITQDGQNILGARLAFGGMAGTPKRAENAEMALTGQDFSIHAFEKAAKALSNDFTPLSDMRGSAQYRMETAQALLLRYFYDLSEQHINVQEVRS